MAEKEVLQLGSPSALRIIQKGGHQKIYLATVDGNSRSIKILIKLRRDVYINDNLNFSILLYLQERGTRKRQPRSFCVQAEQL